MKGRVLITGAGGFMGHYLVKFLAEKSYWVREGAEMKYVIQNYRSCELTIAEVPAPVTRMGYVLVRNRASSVSAGPNRLLPKLL